MKCPTCDETLVMSERQGIEIDYCPKCRGVWLDKGELDKIIEKSASTEMQQTLLQKEQRQHYGESDKGFFDKKRGYENNPKHYNKKDSFLSDLFDF
jgi:Zn-finger nucleic acid-binding protein